MARRSWLIGGLALVLCFATIAVVGLASPPRTASSASLTTVTLGPYRAPLQTAPAHCTAAQFDFVSNF